MPIRCADCGWPIGGVAQPVSVRDRTRAAYSELRPGEHGAWCHRCKRITAYVVREVA